MKKFVLSAVALFLLSISMTACTYNVSMAHTSGGSTDTIDDNLTNTPDVSPTVTVPVSGASVPAIPTIPAIPVAPPAPVGGK